ncbi:eCIS core domain-containing protein [Roseateles sp. P5_E1]
MQARTATARKPRGAASRGPPRAAAAKSSAAGLPRYLQDKAGGGQPLPAPVRTEMEGRFGVPLADVRVHTDGDAAGSAAGMGARAYTAGSNIVFGAAHFAPESAEGRGLLAHELTHVVQQQRAGVPATQPSAADGGAHHDKAEREAEANAKKVASSAPLTAKETPAAGVQRSGILDTLGNAAGAVADFGGDVVDAGVDAAGSAVEAVGEAIGAVAMRLVREVAPSLVPVIERGPMALLREMVSSALDGLASVLNALDPSGTLTTMLGVFTGLVERASGIAAALISGDCQPLLNAIDELKTFVTEVAGEAWDRLTTFLQPIGDFFTDLWNGYGAPAIEWLRSKAGAVWARIEAFGTDIWNWTAPVRNAVGDAWGWVKEQLFGPEDATSADSSGGIVGWITSKAGEAWDWVKEQTAPVWQPIAATAQKVADMLPPPWMRNFGQQMQQMSTQLNASATAMEGGDGVAENRDTLATVLPSVTQVIGTVRSVIVEAGGWVSTKVGALGNAVSSLMGSLRSNSLMAMLANALGWLEDAALRLVSWADEKVRGLFDWILQGFDALTPFIENAVGVVRKLIGVVGDLMRLPQLILSSVWEAIPCCIREPVKNFVFNQILARIPVFGQFFSDPTLWPRVQATALRILRQVFVDGDLAGAAWTFFQSVLRVLGLPPELVVQVLAKAAAAIGDILTDPVGFLINLLGAVKAGFGRFFENIGTHLLNGVSGWLFGQAESAGITPPTDFSIGSIFGFVLQVLGITVEHIFERLTLKLDASTVRRLRQIMNLATGAWHFLSILINEGPAGLWVEIQNQLSNLWDRVLDGVISWVTDAIIGRATRWLMSLLDVTGIMPVINTLVAVYNAIESFMQYLREMLEIVSKVLDGILDIAHGAIDGAAVFLEDALDRAMPVAIGFLANQFGLGRIGERMHELLETVRALVDQAIDWLIDRAIELGQAFIAMARRGVAAVRGAVGAVVQWWRERFSFTTESGEPHELYLEGEGEEGELMVASTPQRFPDFLAGLPASEDRTDAQQKYRRLQQLRRRARSLGSAAPAAGTAAAGGSADPMTSNDPQVVSAAIVALITEIATVTRRLMPAGGGASTPPAFGTVTAQGWARSAQIDRLNAQRSHWPVRGGEPSVTSARWVRLAKRRSDGNAGDHLYVKGHLLNHNLDGPGNIWENLGPITQDANNRGGASMLHAFETDVKTAVDGGGSARNFNVTMNYGRGNRGAALNEINAELATASASRRRELEAVRGVVEEEQYIPSTITCRAEILNASGRRTSNLNISVANTITTRWRNYTVEP